MIPKPRFIIIYVILAVAAAFMFSLSDLKAPAAKPLSDFPISRGGWKMASQTSFSAGVLELLKPTDYISRSYVDREGRKVDLYIGFHSGARESGQIHSPKQCLPGGGWFKVREERASVDAGGKKVKLVNAVYQKGDSRECFIYWYQVKGRPLSDEYSLKLNQVFNSVLFRRRDAAFIRVSLPVDDDDNSRAFSTGRDFVDAFYPAIEEFLPR